MITANHKQPGDPRACDGCSRKGRETYILAIGDKELALCHTCTPIVIEKLSAIGVRVPSPKLEEALENAEASQFEAVEELRGTQAGLESCERQLEDAQKTIAAQNQRIRQLESKQAA